VELEENISLASFTTLRIGGPARYFVSIGSEAELLEAIAFAHERGLPMFTLGGGSNLVVPDEGFPGLVLHATIGGQIRSRAEDGGTLLQVDAGVDWNELVHYTCRLGLCGIECMAGIPGLVGGSPIQNIGAYGQEIATTIRGVRALDLESLTFVDIPHDECGFAYRTSRFNTTDRGRFIVTRVDFLLPRDARPNLGYADLRSCFKEGATPSATEVYEAVRAIRDRKGMLIDPAKMNPDALSAGSFFKNPVVSEDLLPRIAAALSLPAAEIPHWAAGAGRVKLPAAWLIERAGFPKGFTLSEDAPVGISSRHTLALVNRTGSARCADLLELRDRIVGEVERQFGIVLEQEPVTLQP
jgi:UDP-N-acetylmuramate dehydrogenase